MTLDYYYGDQAEQFSFYRIPKVLFTDSRFKDISAEAKILYGLLLDRMSLSAKNGWLDQVGRVYIVYTVEDIMDALSCASQKAMKLLNELDEKCGLIERKRQGLGKPNLIYVKNFVAAPESKFKNGENQNSGVLKIETQEFPKSKGSNTEKNNTDLNDCMEHDDFRKSPLLQSSRGSYTSPALALPAKALDEYAELKAQAADFDPVELYEARQAIRPAQEKAAEQQLEDALQKKPSFSLLLNAKQETSRLLKEDTEERQVRQMLIRRQRSDPQKPKHFQR